MHEFILKILVLSNWLNYVQSLTQYSVYMRQNFQLNKMSATYIAKQITRVTMCFCVLTQ